MNFNDNGHPEPPSKVDALIPISACMPQGIPLKFSLLPKIPLFMHVIRLVVPRASKIESDGPGFCNCTMQQCPGQCSRLIQLYCLLCTHASFIITLFCVSSMRKLMHELTVIMTMSSLCINSHKEGNGIKESTFIGLNFRESP